MAVAASLLVGAGEPAPPTRATEDAVLVAVFRHLADELIDGGMRRDGVPGCLWIDPGGAPQSAAREFLRRFGKRSDLRRGAECEIREGEAVVLQTGGPAVLITAGPIEWIAEDEAHVRVEYFRTRLKSARRLYRVVREPSGWLCLGPIIERSALHAGSAWLGEPPRGR